MKKYISTGGLGDAWIAYLKLDQVGTSDGPIDWLHVESHDKIKDACNELFQSLDESVFKFTFEADPNYIVNYRRGKWNDRLPVSSGIDAFCPLKGDTKMVLTQPFAQSKFSREYDAVATRGTCSEDAPWGRYHIVVQVSGGAKNNRGWRFDPRQLASILRQKGYLVALIGTDERYKDEKDEDNYVCKIRLLDSLSLIKHSLMFIGLSGFMNYYACSMHVPNVHLIESEEHEKRYYHPWWRQYVTGVKLGTIQEILAEVKKIEV